MWGAVVRTNKFGTHWMRRKADKVAVGVPVDNMEKSGVDADTINEAFGWKQRARNKKQQFRYRGATELKKLAKVNLYL